MFKPLFIFLLSASAYAAEPALKRAPLLEDESLSGFYLRGDIASSTLAVSGINPLTGATFGAGVGYRFDHFRVDVTGDARVQSQGFKYTAILVNGYYDIATFYGFTPYVGAGVGYSQFTALSTSVSGLAYGLMLGTSYAINKNVDLDLGYRYLSLAQGILPTRPAAHEVRFGVRYRFD